MLAIRCVGLMLLLLCARLLPAQESIQSIGARAQQLETEGRWNEAAEAYRQILAIDPKSIAALNRLGRTLCAPESVRRRQEVLPRSTSGGSAKLRHQPESWYRFA